MEKEKGKEITSSLHIPGNFHCLVLELYMWVTQMKKVKILPANIVQIGAIKLCHFTDRFLVL